MSHKRYRPSAKDRLTDYCSQPGEDDGVDPRYAVRSSRRAPTIDRKTLQMCGQVAHIVQAVLSSEMYDDDLSGLIVVSVVPTSQRGKLLISVTPGTIEPVAPPDVILAKLKQQVLRIRAEVSGSITRRKTPELAFAYLPKVMEETSHE